ncbi:hypothetical protein BV25DRAFT_1842782 [Artomyces pyxidatus]|uniref:Uncharacterized protein n=1 Tax=Artomyces pyxidatus TaxID=48021 RepID=A0ACB8SHN2_9AGAM|nr:hypothetical protein BV25DRAFT_1842782 [Artomyces pyxidatus]
MPSSEPDGSEYTVGRLFPELRHLKIEDASLGWDDTMQDLTRGLEGLLEGRETGNLPRRRGWTGSFVIALLQRSPKFQGRGSEAEGLVTYFSIRRPLSGGRVDRRGSCGGRKADSWTAATCQWALTVREPVPTVSLNESSFIDTDQVFPAFASTRSPDEHGTCFSTDRTPSPGAAILRLDRALVQVGTPNQPRLWRPVDVPFRPVPPLSKLVRHKEGRDGRYGRRAQARVLLGTRCSSGCDGCGSEMPPTSVWCHRPVPPTLTAVPLRHIDKGDMILSARALKNLKLRLGETLVANLAIDRWSELLRTGISSGSRRPAVGILGARVDLWCSPRYFDTASPALVTAVSVSALRPRSNFLFKALRSPGLGCSRVHVAMRIFTRMYESPQHTDSLGSPPPVGDWLAQSQASPPLQIAPTPVSVPRGTLGTRNRDHDDRPTGVLLIPRPQFEV